MSEFVPLYAYEFTYRKAPWYFPPMSFGHGAAHMIDIPFLFPAWHGGPLGILHKLNAEERRLSTQLVAAWTNFMYTGNSNLKGDRPWPRYTKSPEVYLPQDVTGLTIMSAAQFAAAHKCAFWDTILIYETRRRS
ncbi:MAG: carboxylesterase family protein [Acetobacteraceae bacterium]|nr:carboxylesterase family protein [Acetobacteraceae bacterium]